jgi:hypothetical protein
MTVRARRAVGGIAVVALAIAAAVVAVTLVKSAPSGSRTPAAGLATAGTAPAPAPAAPAPAVPGPTTTVNPALGPPVPAHGAYIGAYVQPAGYSEPSKIAAMQALQQQAGGRLDIVHSYLKWQVPFPKPNQQAILDQGSILLLSWAGGDTKVIASGRDDGWIRQQARAIKATHKPILLEWRWEMNRLALYSQVHKPADYVAAWDHIRSIFTKEHVRNVAWVWCPSSNGFATYGPAFYPGNSEVDWLCADVYPQGRRYAQFAAVAQPFLDWASHIAKPIMIGEYGAPRSYGPHQRAAWLHGVARMARLDPQIKALVYFDGDPPGNPPGSRYRLDPGSAPMLAFRRIADEPYFDPDRLRTPGRPG